ncbi:ABC transporter ATP-binding protein [Leptospira semungkisensis]|uniref:ABC transporter ATP-binding protein n=1 Tax=Leptospira semungkisensis TaxID=2484985 RepID=A0A4R9G2R1_9LEPT|nr:ATP-binding cassette domain-containing protein [Leptospira semungkisensis]TGK04897.1 ABC transporter ATP-binding protein [Leptospira semungkisensis]
MQSIITANDVSFEFANGRVLFKNLNFSLGPKITALVGSNGVGKTHLAKIIAGLIDPSAGEIRRKQNVLFFSQRQEPEHITVREFLDEYSWSLLGDTLLSGINQENTCDNLSGGEWMRVRLAQIQEEGYLILDEPTNDLDQEAKEVLIRFLREYESGVLLISHDRRCLSLCEEVLELSNQGLNKYGVGWEFYQELKEKERESSIASLERARRERDKALAKRTEEREKQERRNKKGERSAAKGGAPKILLGARKQSAESTSGKLNSSTLEKSNQKIREVYETMDRMKVDPVMYADLMGNGIPSQKLVAEAIDLNIKFQDWIYEENLNFAWKGNIRISINGPNGSGKSTLLKAILGNRFETKGDLRIGKLNTLYVSQGCEELQEEKSIFENVRDVSSLMESEIRNGLAKFLFFGEGVFQKCNSLSGGERLRAALAVGLLGANTPELLILDEPTNNLDLENIEFLERLVKEFPGAVVAVSHDDMFLQNCDIPKEFAIKRILRT